MEFLFIAWIFGIFCGWQWCKWSVARDALILRREADKAFGVDRNAD